MTRFRSGRVTHQNIGISSFTENKLVLDVIGNARISGILSVPQLQVTGVGGQITGDINTRNLNVIGITTLGGPLSVGGSTGQPGQYLKSTGVGLEWGSFPAVRDTVTYIATAGQTQFSFNYNTNFVDVYVNGVKLTASEFVATSGNLVILNSACFEGDVIELISFNTTALGGGGGGGGFGNVAGINTLATSHFNHINAAGVITATAFYGSGEFLTDVPGSKQSGYAHTAGIATVAEGLTGIPDINVGVVTASEIHLDDNNEATFGNSNDLKIFHNGSHSVIRDEGTGVLFIQGDSDVRLTDVGGNEIYGQFNKNSSVDLYYDNSKKFETTGYGATVTGEMGATLFTGPLSGDATGLSGVPSITVDNIVANNISVAATLTYEDVKNVDSIGIVTARSGIRVYPGYGIYVQSGIVTANDFYGNLTGDVAGTATTAITANNAEGLSGRPHIDVRGIESTGIKVVGLVTANTFVGNLVGSVQGGNINAYDGTFTNNVSAAASITASNGYYGDGSNVTGIVTVSDNAPPSVFSGKLWWKSDEGRLKVYYDDGNSSQWVDATPGGGGGGGGGGNSDLLNDTTPQLGGDLDVNDKNIVFGDSTTSTDDRLKFGAGQDLQIYHDGSASYILEQGSGELRLLTNQLRILNTTNNEDIARFTEDGSVDLYYDNSKKFETTGYGVTVTGIVSATSFSGDVNATALNLSGVSTFKDSVDLLDNVKLNIGTGDDLQIYHNGTHSYIDDAGAGNLHLRSGTLSIQNLAGSKTSALFNSGSGQELYYDNSKKFETTTHGVYSSGIISATSFIGDGSGLDNIYAAPPAGISTTGYTILHDIDASGDLDVSGISTFGGKIKASSTDNVIPFYYDNLSQLPSSSTYHGAFAHVHSTGRAYFAHAGWKELVNRESTGIVGTGTDTYNIGSLDVVDAIVSRDLKVSGITTLGSVKIAGFGSNIEFESSSNSGSSQYMKFWVGNQSGTHYATIDGSGGAFQIYNTSHPTGTLDFRAKEDYSFQVNGYYSILNQSSGGVKLFHPASQGNILSHKLETLGIGVTVVGTTFSNQLSVSGVATATSFDGSLAYTNLTGITTSILGDTSPQLGGNLDNNGKNIVIGDCTTPGADNTLQIGATASGLQMHHRPTSAATYIQNNDPNTNLWITGQNTNGTWGNIFIRPYLNAFSGVACWWGGATELYYGNTGSKKLETTSGGVTITGTLSKSGGSFKIPHPIAGISTTKHLVHSFIEGPQMDLIYRGKTTLVAGISTVNIDQKVGMTEGTFVLLNRDVQCFTTNETGWTSVKGSVTGNEITIIAQDDTCTDTISWMVVGERQDDTVRSLDMTDDEGNLIVEPDQQPVDSRYDEVQSHIPS